MALIALGCDLPTEAAVTDFYRRVRERYPYPTTNRRDLSYRDVIAAATEGASFAVDRYSMDASELERVEEVNDATRPRSAGTCSLSKTRVA